MTGDAAPAERARPGGRVRKGTLPPLPPAKLEKWMVEAGLAVRREDGTLEPTRRGHAIGGALTGLG